MTRGDRRLRAESAGGGPRRGGGWLEARAWRITAVYAVFASLWIYFSDQVLAALIPDAERLVQLSVYKGLAFVAVTSLLLLVLTRRAFG
ncbi:MAG: hypothetical protein LC667_16340, partial [Thioalkalivibrio sp.]|nr:hypothetical protein [Thioalkalivibrio sp.]